MFRSILPSAKVYHQQAYSPGVGHVTQLVLNLVRHLRLALQAQWWWQQILECLQEGALPVTATSCTVAQECMQGGCLT